MEPVLRDSEPRRTRCKTPTTGADVAIAYIHETLATKLKRTLFWVKKKEAKLGQGIFLG